ncbi:MAG TPA: tetratricopeptide repeat protein [Roseiflexaceae bacterium]|nr:tetratricopeptide repeat protein [Roseiflexaceae bacterium]
MTNLDLLGRTLGPFEIISELGRGGMAVVYKARQTNLDRTVALKILPPELSLDKSYLARFLQEARNAAALEHPHIVTIHDVGSAEGFNYIAMKYIAGKTLKDIVQERGALDLAQAAVMLDQVAGALDYAHSRGVIHRDIKPSNMMADQNGWVYLTDFGLARGGTTGGLTMTGTVMGTPEYMSPEQAQGLPTIGSPTDIYALGVVLYELLTGQMPFQADTPMGMLVARLQYAPRPPRDYRSDLPMPVEDVIMRALARKPEARYPSAKEMIGALKSAAGLGSSAYTLPQRPVSPAVGVPATPTQPASPYQGVQQPASPAFGLPPTQAASPPQGTPPYVIPANSGQPASLPRAATPPAMPVGVGGLPPNPTIPVAQKPRRRRGLLIGGAIALVILLALVGVGFMLGRPNPRIASGLDEGRVALAQKGGIDKAIEAYKQVIELDPNNVTAHTQLALIYNLRDRNKDAEESARKAIAADANAAYARAILAEALSGQGDYKAALDEADQAVELNDKLSFGYGARSGIKANLAVEDSNEDMLKEAAADADKALELAASEDNMAKALAHSARGYVYWQEYTLTDDQSKVDSGVQEYNQAIGLQGQIALFHSNLGYFYDAQAKHDLARQKFEAALDADDQYGHSHAGLGWNLYYLEDYPGALAEFDKALELNAEDSDAYVGKSKVYLDQDEPNYDLAIEALAKAAEIEPNDPSLRSRMGWANRDKATSFKYASAEQKDTYAEAEQQFRKALELNEDYVDALTGLGWVLQDQADVLKDNARYEESIDTLKRSLDVKDDQPFAYSALGWSYYGLEEYDDAVESFNKAIELKSDYADANYGLGRALEGQGKPDEARAAYQQAIALGSSYAQDALDQLK